MTREVSSTDLVDVINEIFGSMAGMELVPSPNLIAFDRRAGHVVASVQIVGEWQAAVRLDIDLALARQACANLVGLTPDELSAQDICDVAGELANMAAGSVKALCSPISRLSLPNVAVGTNFEFTVAQGSVIRKCSFTHSSGALTVSVIEKQT